MNRFCLALLPALLFNAHTVLAEGAKAESARGDSRPSKQDQADLNEKLDNLNSPAPGRSDATDGYKRGSYGYGVDPLDSSSKPKLQYGTNSVGGSPSESNSTRPVYNQQREDAVRRSTE